ncbi:FHA domain-containing protein [Gilvimarinus sp. F26214L]|uniref:FHA domain-containing protein n=1 Tax=Gilvimarinus sp. DZF01 TaxID=3461371 RepID=UPI004046369C
MLKLRFTDNKHNGVWLVEPKVTIGSAAGNDLVLEDPSVAPHHAEILVRHEKLTLVNLAGQALQVNNRPVPEQMEINKEDQLLVGKLRLEVMDPKQQYQSAGAAANETTGWALKANHSALANRVFPIKAETVIGRSSDCDITLAAAHLSRRHVKLFVENGLLYMRDLGSANGTYLNGQKVVEARVRRGDELRFDTLSFGVIGPAAEDLDRTTVRPMAAVNVKSGNSPTAPRASSAHNVRAAHLRRHDADLATERLALDEAGPDSDLGNGSRNWLWWGFGLLVATAGIAGFLWQQGMLGG